jgi:hypothetical protein
VGPPRRHHHEPERDVGDPAGPQPAERPR